MNAWIVVNIGCIECGVSSDIVGVFSDKNYADELVRKLEKTHAGCAGGHNTFDVFEMPELNVVNSEYISDK